MPGTGAVRKAGSGSSMNRHGIGSSRDWACPCLVPVEPVATRTARGIDTTEPQIRMPLESEPACSSDPVQHVAHQPRSAPVLYGLR